MIKFRKNRKGALPNVIIIGAQKCATTSLHYYLNLHPQIAMSREKELNFFISERNWHRGTDWYKSQFSREVKVRGESSPDYTNYPFFEDVPARIFRVVPEVKLIYILRDPVERIISHYIHEVAARRENRKISDALKTLDDNPYIVRSQYFMQVTQYLEYFSQSDILILSKEELHADRRKNLQKVFRFLEVDDYFYSRRYSSIRHKSRQKRRKSDTGSFLYQNLGRFILKPLPVYIRWHFDRLLFLPFSYKIKRPKLDEGLRRTLIEYLEDNINQLRKFTGFAFKGWAV